MTVNFFFFFFGAKMTVKSNHYHFVMCGDEDKIEEVWRISPPSLCPRQCHVSQSRDSDVPTVWELVPPGCIFPWSFSLCPWWPLTRNINAKWQDCPRQIIEFPPNFLKNFQEKWHFWYVCHVNQVKTVCSSVLISMIQQSVSPRVETRLAQTSSGARGEGTLGNSHDRCMDHGQIKVKTLAAMGLFPAVISSTYVAPVSIMNLWVHRRSRGKKRKRKGKNQRNKKTPPTTILFPLYCRNCDPHKILTFISESFCNIG